MKFSNNVFGIIRLGRWLTIEPAMKIGIETSNTTWRTYSQSNRNTDIQKKDYRIMLYDRDNKPIMPLKKCVSSDVARTELETLCVQLGVKNILQ